MAHDTTAGRLRAAISRTGVVQVEFDPQFWAQLGAVGVGFGWLLYVVTTRLQQAIDRNTEALQQLSRQVQVNTLLVARVTGQDAGDLERLLVDGGR